MSTNAETARIPVTIVTGFLGSGKTTLLGGILAGSHGRRIAVIENEYGAINIDHDLVVNVDEQIVELSNGCLCCTVRGDLIRVLGQLWGRRDRFDYVVVETTGLADPGPVAQTFFVEAEVRDRFELDGIVTVVDAFHVEQQLGRSAECAEQIGFADVVVLNKGDMVARDDLDALEVRIRSMNRTARVLRAVHGDVDPGELIERSAFDLEQTLARRPSFLEPEYPFEWTGVYALDGGRHVLELDEGPDPSMRLVLLGDADVADGWLRAGAERCVRRFSEEAVRVAPGARVPVDVLVELDLSGRAPSRFVLDVPDGGHVALYAQHHGHEFGLRVRRGAALDARPASRRDRPPFRPRRAPERANLGEVIPPETERAWVTAHAHDDDVGSIAVDVEGAVDPARFDAWLGRLLGERGTDLFRMKGFLHIDGDDRRFVFQGVHMLVGGYADRPWGDGPRRNQLVIIGRRLDRDAIVEGFRACLR
jgi:G3E family GTPase